MLEHRRNSYEVAVPTVSPLPVSHAPPSTGKETSVRHIVRARILLVDDDETAAKALARLLDMECFDCRVALDYRSALRTASEWLPDVVVCDIDLHSNRDGPDVLRAMRTAHPTIQGISISGLDPAEAVARSQAGGFATHLRKPFDVEQLANALRSLMMTPARVGRHP